MQEHKAAVAVSGNALVMQRRHSWMHHPTGSTQTSYGGVLQASIPGLQTCLVKPMALLSVACGDGHVVQHAKARGVGHPAVVARGSCQGEAGGNLLGWGSCGGGRHDCVHACHCTASSLAIASRVKGVSGAYCVSGLCPVGWLGGGLRALPARRAWQIVQQEQLGDIRR